MEFPKLIFILPELHHEQFQGRGPLLLVTQLAKKNTCPQTGLMRYLHFCWFSFTEKKNSLHSIRKKKETFFWYE